MKILAFSDWRTPPREILLSIMDEYKPDAIVYAGDDIYRFIPSSTPILFKTGKHIIELSYPEFSPIEKSKRRVFTPAVSSFLEKLAAWNPFFMDHFIPFHYVNGNDDPLLNHSGRLFTRLHGAKFKFDNKTFYLNETSTGRICFSRYPPFAVEITRRCLNLLPREEMPHKNIAELDDYSTWGLYAPIQPSFGHFDIVTGKERISAFGFQCEYGSDVDVTNFPLHEAHIFISHLPPYGTLDLSQRFGVNHIGSKRLLRAIKKYQPNILICGHSHLWGGNVKKIGNTIVLNISSHDSTNSPANYAIINTNNWAVELLSSKKKSFLEIPGMRKLFNDISEKPMLAPVKFRKSRPTDAKQLLSLLDHIEKQGRNVKMLKERVKSLSWEKPKIIKALSFNPRNQVFVDVETGSFQGRYPGNLWLIGLLYKDKIRQFLYPKEEASFLRFLKINKIKSLASWTGYDALSLRPIFDNAQIGITFIDACKRIRNCIIWHTFKLHDLYSALFGPSSINNECISGFEAGVYADHLILSKKRCSYCPSKRDIMGKIRDRNKIDLLQMKEVCMLVWQFR